MHPCPQEIEEILRKIKEAIKYGKYTFVPRQKNMNVLLKYNLSSFSEIVHEMNRLTCEHYVSGPEIDRDRPNSEPLWTFKQKIYNDIFYIKVKIIQESGFIKIISFHIDER